MLPLIQTAIRELQMLQSQWKAQIDPVISNSLIDGNQLKNISLVIGNNVINHKLARNYQGYIITGLRQNFSQIVESPSQRPDLNIILTSSAACTIDLYVFQEISMATTLTPNMSLTLPGVGTESGPDYAIEINNDLSILDGHDHTSGYGTPVPTAGININADLSLNGFNLTTSRTLRLQTQTSTPAQSTDLGILYRLGSDLYYIDGSGNNIRITQSGSVSGSAGTITGLPSGTASASYGSGTFTFQAATSTPANIDGGSYILRNNVASSKGLTLSPPSSMGADISMTLPALPGSQKIMTLDNSGNMAAAYGVDGTTLTISSNNLQIATNGVNTTQIATAAVTLAKMAANSVTTSNYVDGSIITAKIVDQNVTLAKLALPTQILSNTCGTASTTSVSFSQVTNFSIGITLVGGRTVDIFVLPDGSATEGRIVLDSGSTPAPNARGFIQLKRNGGVIGFYTVSLSGFAGSIPLEIGLPGNLRFIDTGASAGANTYSLEFCVDAGSTTLTFTNLKLIAREV